MTDSTHPPLPAFSDFFRVLRGYRPFPWQDRLAAYVASEESWPKEIGIPTGLGKTACLEVAIWWLASQADRAPRERTAPTRIWWIVNRRLLIDSTYESARHIAEALEHPASVTDGASDRDVLQAVSRRLRSLSASPTARPLEIIRLRGNVSAGRPTDPSQPAVVLSTLPMYGSRLLFRGYGVSKGMRPVDAALAGTDSLLLLDEAHLAPHLKALLAALPHCTPGAEDVLPGGRSRPTLVAMTATGHASDEDRFDLDEADYGHRVIRQRLDAPKPMEVREESGKPEKKLERAVLDLIDAKDRKPTACLVFANTPKVARATFERLQKVKGLRDHDLVLLTGRTREQEAETVRSRILDRASGMPAGGEIDRQKHLIAVATQTLEVGADIDAELLVTEACGVRALTQRLGRLNRLGRHPNPRATYVHIPPKGKNGWPVYGTEPETVLGRLRDAAERSGDSVDLSPRRIADILGEPEDDAGRAPEVLYGLLWEWIKTTIPPEGEAPVEPYFSGVAQPSNHVSLIWRVHVPEHGARLWPRPRDVESVDVPVWEAQGALDGRVEALRRLSRDRVTVERCEADQLRPGDIIVLPTSAGLLDEMGWNPSAAEAVADVSLQDRGLPLDAGAIAELCGVSVNPLIRTALGESEDDRDDEIDASECQEAVRQLIEQLAETTPTGWTLEEWDIFLKQLDSDPVQPREEVARLKLRRQTAAGEVAHGDNFDESSLASTAVDLDKHLTAVGRWTGRASECIGLPDSVRDTLVWAGRWHDLGKRDQRFQRWLDPDAKSPTPVAKSDYPRERFQHCLDRSGWPRGGRHEALSARLAQKWFSCNPDARPECDRDLLVHLLITHHGHGRPIVSPVADGTTTSVTAPINGSSVTVSADLADIDWNQPRRFAELNERYGPWGLALLEAVLRLSDHAVSGGAAIGSPDDPQ